MAMNDKNNAVRISVKPNTDQKDDNVLAVTENFVGEQEPKKKKSLLKKLYKGMYLLAKLGVMSAFSMTVGKYAGELTYPNYGEMTSDAEVKRNMELLGVETSYANSASGVQFNNYLSNLGKKPIAFLNGYSETTRLAEPKDGIKYKVILDKEGFKDEQIQVLENVVEDVNAFYSVVNDKYSFELTYDMSLADDDFSILINSGDLNDNLLAQQKCEKMYSFNNGRMIREGVITFDAEYLSFASPENYLNTLNHEFIGHQLFGLADSNFGSDFTDTLMDYSYSGLYLSRNDYLLSIAKYADNLPQYKDMYIKFVDDYMQAEQSENIENVKTVCSHYAELKDEYTM